MDAKQNVYFRKMIVVGYRTWPCAPPFGKDIESSMSIRYSIFMATLMKNPPRLNLVLRLPNGQRQVIYRYSGREWLLPDELSLTEMQWGKCESHQATVLPFKIIPRKTDNL
jgi:hypothetical protein